MELREYFRLIRTQWKLLLLCVVVAVAVAAVVVLRTTPTYQSTATLFVGVTPADDSTTSAYQGSLLSQQRARSYADLVRGEAVTTAVVKQLRLPMTPAELSARVSARILPDTTLLEITTTDTAPARAQRINQAVSRQFVAFAKDLERPDARSPSPLRATVVDSPSRPDSPVAPRPVRTLALGLIAGLVLGTGLALLRELLDRTIKNTEALNAWTGAPNLGVIAHDPQAQAKPLVVHLEPRSPRSESFRQLRTNLQFVDVDRRPKRIVVTSSVPAEGKTTTTCNLAITLAQAGRRVVLVEGDIRRPRLAEYLGIEGAVGLTSVLIGRIAAEDALQPWGDIPLEVLASGPLPPNPSELLQSRAMELLLGDLDRRADVVLVDAPPLLPVTDASILARMADGTVLVVRHGSTTADQVDAAVGNLAKVDARLLGTVLNMAPARGPDARTYGYGYDYGRDGGRDAVVEGVVEDGVVGVRSRTTG
ncbi:non-specific protein-tyrosine kinase [Actinopolymorpha cephalotaxi]|uniref:non-specific protein-tyrosine kinase n=1 Tax=Actinopolymorpha cephalotaxi TaxID=504797 RepID=A0A1I2XYM4_9ACTN|nr:polysaccharide biosynthesis tyrosine autokinase [Actinopolymorpha cephalotaxi]NYH87223.1 capsular exopolysaccharide synthesis family protein [Actinopolymorpha cephalotaxi]SFH17826.1 non-specific protein-tyrosine kinase [Actinopolymorpha cephalotaxi]